MEHRAYYDCPLGILEIHFNDQHVSQIKLTTKVRSDHHPSPLSDLAATQLQEYLAGTRREFDFPTMATGTAFQQSVWNALLTIPYGETRTYSQIAAQIGKPGAARAVGMACNRNPIWIAIPCHRVVGGDKSLTGYAGGLHIKRHLLNLELKNK